MIDTKNTDTRIAIYVYASGLLIIKMILLAISTSFVRNRNNKVTLNLEDANLVKVEVSTVEHPAVARVKRAHLNDLENVPAFLFVAFIWIQTGQAIILVHIFMWLYVISRYVHTLVYAYYPVPQPARAISYLVGLLITIAMIIMNFIKYFNWF